MENAIKIYNKHFIHNIQNLLGAFRPNYKNRDSSDFWVGKRR